MASQNITVPVIISNKIEIVGDSPFYLQEENPFIMRLTLNSKDYSQLI